MAGLSVRDPAVDRSLRSVFGEAGGGKGAGRVSPRGGRSASGASSSLPPPSARAGRNCCRGACWESGGCRALMGRPDGRPWRAAGGGGRWGATLEHPPPSMQQRQTQLLYLVTLTPKRAPPALQRSSKRRERTPSSFPLPPPHATPIQWHPGVAQSLHG